MAGGSLSPVLSQSQLETLAELGEEATAEPGETLYEIGDESYPFIAILEGEVAITNAAGGEIVRHGASGFLGEMNLLTGQTVFLTAVAKKPTRYITVKREALRKLLAEDSSLADLLLATFVSRREGLQEEEGIGIEIVGPRASEETRRIVDWARRARIPHSWIDPESIGAWTAQADGDETADPSGGSPAGWRGAAAAEHGRDLPRARHRPRAGVNARRSTCSSSAVARRVSARPSTGPPRASTRW